MAETPPKIHCFTLIKIQAEAVCVEASKSPDKEKHFAAVRGLIPKLKEFDSKRKDKGSVPLEAGVAYYEIDCESFAHIAYVSQEYPNRAAETFVAESVGLLEKTVPQFEEADPSKIQSDYQRTAGKLVDKYSEMKNLTEKPTADSVGSKVAQATDKMRDNLLVATQNEQDLKIMQQRSANTKLISEEMNYEAEDLREATSWDGKKVYLIAAAVVGLIIVVLIVTLI